MTDDITRRRFGPKFNRKCERPEVVECALWECQSIGHCQHSEQARMAKVLEVQRDRPRGISIARKERGE